MVTKVNRSKHHRAKRLKKEQKHNNKKVITIMLLVVVIAVVYLIINQKIFATSNTDIASTEENTIENTTDENANVVETNQTPQDQISNVEIPETMGGYKVLGQLVIEKIGVTKNILSTAVVGGSMEVSVGKLYGPGVNINTAGNFCICGHNSENMLKRLSEMQVGDMFYLINRETKTKVDYKIYNRYTCNPEDISCLDQNYDGKREVTLITCVPGGLTRLICKAREA